MNTYVTPIKESDLLTDGDRLWASLMEMAKLGATPKGGVNRQALTDLDRQGRDLFIQWCRAEAARFASIISAISLPAGKAATPVPKQSWRAAT